MPLGARWNPWCGRPPPRLPVADLHHGSCIWSIEGWIWRCSRWRRVCSARGGSGSGPWRRAGVRCVAAAVALSTWVIRPLARRRQQPPWQGRRRARWAGGGGHLGEGSCFCVSALASMVENVVAWCAAVLRFSALTGDGEGGLVWMVVGADVGIWLSPLGRLAVLPVEHW